jgi:hypothetical protein
MVTEQDGRQSVIVSTYRVAGREFANATRAQLWYSWQTLRSLGSPRSEVAAWRMDCGNDCELARSKIEDFLGLTDGHS